MIAETFGSEDANASYPFVVGDGATLSGTVEFLSDEWPVYFGQEYNDLYTVTLATPGGVVVLASGNLNNSSWVDGSDHGYSGTADAVAVNADLRRFAGQVAELQIHVANVGDDAVESAVVISDLRIDAAAPCDDEALAGLHGLASASGGDRLDSLDHLFNGPDGASFHNLVQLVADEAAVEPGLLAVTALEAEGSLDAWLSADGLAAADVGLPDWATAEAELRAALPDAPAIATTAPGTFATGRDALRALAWTLRHVDAQLTAEAGAAYSDLPANERMTLQAFAVDQGAPAAVELAGSGSVLDADPAATGPQRAATVRGGQAVHLSYNVFGMGASCGP